MKSWWAKRHFILYSIIFIQTLLICIGFHKVVFDGQSYLFMDSFDGMRNYFAYHDYILQGKNDDFFLFNQMNYPFGDYIFYTDNTPLIAIPVKWFSENIYDLSHYDLQIFHWCFALMMLLSSILLYFIIQPFIQSKWLIFTFSLAIPWISPQLIRLNNGHFGLGLTLCILAVMYGLIRLYQSYSTGSKKIVFPILSIITAVVLSSFLHLYFLVINGFFIGYFCLFWACSKWKNKVDFFKISALAAGIPLASLGVVLSIIRAIDTYYLQRSDIANGFYKMALNVRFDAIYQPYSYSTIPTYLPTPLELHYEQYAYIGAFALYGLTFFFIFWPLKKWNKNIFRKYLFQTPSHQIVTFLLFSGIGCLWISFGLYAYFFGNLLRFDNWLNPFYWLSDILPQVTHFRYMGRFNWVFFLTINFAILFWLDQYSKQTKSTLKRILIVILPLFLTLDMYDSICWQYKHGSEQPLTNSDNLAQIREITSTIDINQYQAILPLPYYHSSCEDFNYTIDADDDDWCTTTYQFSTVTKLPLMASKTGRTPLDQTYALLDIFLKDEIPELIISELSPKPILVIYKDNEYTWTLEKAFEPANTAFLKGKDFPKKHQLKELARLGEWILYEWDWQAALKD